jgi:hypothetical protein
MGIMDIVRKMKGNKSDFKNKLKNAEENLKIDNALMERQKSSNQREVERYFKEQEEKEYKKMLDKIRKERNEENWKSKDLILAQKTTMLKTDRPILKEKNLFKNKKNLFIDNKNKVPLQNKREGMFFRW